MIGIILFWLGIGLLSSITAICAFRQGKERQELILAALGPFFGIVVLALLMIDIYKHERQIDKQNKEKNNE